MMSGSQEIIASFPLESWHPLTEVPASRQSDAVRDAAPAAPQIQTLQAQMSHELHPALRGVSSDLIKLLYDILAYLYANVRARIKRLNVSGRVFEKAKLEGLERGFFVEGTAGATTYLIPLAKTFAAFDSPCPYRRDVSPEHSYFVGLGRHLLQQNPGNKRVYTELKVGNSGCTADIVTIGQDFTRCAYEVTLSTTNILSNAAKYAHTDFAQIVFLCRDQKLRDAVRVCCREGGLDADLLTRLEFIQFSTLLGRQRRLSL